MKLTPLMIVLGLSAAAGAAPALGQGILANSGNLALPSSTAPVASSSGASPHFPGDPHQSTTVVALGAGTGGVSPGANGGDLGKGIGVQKNVAAPSATSAAGNHNATVIVEAGTQKDNDLQSGLLGRAIVTRDNGAQQKTTFREADVNLPKAPTAPSTNLH